MSLSFRIADPQFFKRDRKKDAPVCSKCLESVNEAYVRYKREQLDEQGRIYGHEHVHEH